MNPILGPLYLSLFLLLIGEWQSSAYTPIDDFALNCGSSCEQLNEDDSLTWSADINELSPIEAAGRGNNTSQCRKAIPSSYSASKIPYTTARLSYSEFTYKIPLSPGQKFIRLHFNPASYYPDFDHSNSLFSVKAGGSFTFLKDFNASVTALHDISETVMREFCVNIDPELQSLNITFTPTKHAYAFINGIEIVSMPDNLYYTAPQSPGIEYLSGAVNYYIENTTALETVYRINVGGSPLSPKQDTGMYRNWDADDDIYLDHLSKRFSVIPSNTSIKLKFDVIPEYTAPEEVYQTARTMGPNKTINRSYNLTWVLPVDPSFNYFIRLHFCEFQNEVTATGDRLFLIYIANQTAEEHADVIRWSGGNGIPVFRDYIVYISSRTTQQKVNLFLGLQANPSGWAVTQYNDAILNAFEIFKLNDSNGNLAGLNPLNNINKEKSIPMAAIIAGVVSSILVFSVLGYLVFTKRWKVKDSGSSNRKTKSIMTPGSSLPSYLCRYFSLAEIKAATKNFNDTFIIGAGGFGNVYKGSIDGGATAAAIKRLKPESSQGAQEFKTEIEMLSQLRHRHLVSLIGYCADKGEMILVYDYMARGTLRNHLYHTNNPPLPWEQRLQICIGTARGLQYLHSGSKGTIIHRDVKSTNILLDDKWVAKVSDFGLSKGTNNMTKTHISTMVKGSFGYLDPEYYRRQRLTEKSDVYSLGVVLFEVLCARPAVIHSEELKQVSLAEWAKSCHQNGELDQIIDPSLRGKIAAECLHKFSEVAISCIHDNGTDRPSMNDVVRGLEFALQLQKSAEGNSNCTERNVETETSSSEQSCATIDSIKCISASIFSEINDPSGR